MFKDPKRYLLDIWKIIKSDGLLIIAVPNVNDLVMQFAYRIVKQRKLKLFKKGDKEVHLYHFSTKTLKVYLNEAGFQCDRLMPDFRIIENSKRLIKRLGNSTTH